MEILDSGIDHRGRQYYKIELGRALDLTDKVFERLTPLFRVGGDTIKKVSWLCKCSCDNLVVVTANSLQTKHVRSCGCLQKDTVKQTGYANRAELVGRQFGRLTVLEHVDIYKDVAEIKKRRSHWKCICDCGKDVIVCYDNLVSGHTNSCGCLRKELSTRMCEDRREDLSGRVFGKLTVIELDLEYKVIHGIKQGAFWKCKCACGGEKTIRASSLTTGSTGSCGCESRSLGEMNIQMILDDNNINYIMDRQFFLDLVMPGGGIGRYDFILVDENNTPYRIIEYDGEQHFITGGAGFQPLEKYQKYDKVKNEYAWLHNIPIVRIPYSVKMKITFEMLMSDEFLVKPSK